MQIKIDTNTRWDGGAERKIQEKGEGTPEGGKEGSERGDLHGRGKINMAGKGRKW